MIMMVQAEPLKKRSLIMFMWGVVCSCECKSSQRPEEGAGSSEAGVTRVCELPDIGVGITPRASARVVDALN